MNVEPQPDQFAVLLRRRLQTPDEGPIHIEQLQWLVSGKGGEQKEAVLHFRRAKDFIAGQEIAGSCNFTKGNSRLQKKELTWPKYDSIKESRIYKCEYGPEDLSGGKPGGHQGPKRSKVDKGLSCKVGCKARFIIAQCYSDPDLCRVIINVEGIDHAKHGRDWQPPATEPHLARRKLPARLSKEKLAWVQNRIKLGVDVPAIQAEHVRHLQLSGKLDMPDLLTRDDLLKPQDIRNQQTRMGGALWRLAANQGTGVHIWTQERPDVVFSYQMQEMGPGGTETKYFTLGIQFPFQQQVMLEYGHGRAITMDATFGTNNLGFYFYTLMVFDEHHNGVPVAWVITSSTKEENLVVWMADLQRHVRVAKPGFQPSCFLVDDSRAEINAIRLVWQCYVILCIWHLLRNFLNNLLKKERVREVRQKCFRSLQGIIFLARFPGESRDAFLSRASAALLAELAFFPPEIAQYITTYYSDRLDMWCKGARMDFDHCGQNTTSAVEGYHGAFLKPKLSILCKAGSNRDPQMLLYALEWEMLPQIKFVRLLKKQGMLQNLDGEKRARLAVDKAATMPDSVVKLTTGIPGAAVVYNESWTASLFAPSGIDDCFEVYGADGESGEMCCSCPAGIQGEVCWHSIKMLRMLHPALKEEQIILALGTFKGMAGCGVASLLGKAALDTGGRAEASASQSSSAAPGMSHCSASQHIGSCTLENTSPFLAEQDFMIDTHSPIDDNSPKRIWSLSY